MLQQEIHCDNIIDSDPVQNKDTDVEASLKSVIEEIVLQNKEFDVQDTLPNVVPDPSSLQLNSEYSCPVGKVSI